MNDKYAGLPVGGILDDYNLDRSDLALTDEPPGNLVAISFETFAKSTNKKEVTIWLQSSPKLFDEKRSWSLDTMRDAIVAALEVREK